jgi:hypothetical protein
LPGIRTEEYVIKHPTSRLNANRKRKKQYNSDKG